MSSKEEHSFPIHTGHNTCFQAHKTRIRNLSLGKTDGASNGRDSSSIRLTVALVARIYPPFQSFGLSELGQHFCQHALCLVNRNDPFLNGVVALREFQGKIPKGFNGVGFVVACYAGDLGMKCAYTNKVMYMYTCRLPFTFMSKEQVYAQKAVQFHRHKDDLWVKRNTTYFQSEN